MSEFHIFTWDASQLEYGVITAMLVVAFIQIIRLSYFNCKLKTYLPEQTLLILIGLTIGLILVLSNTETSQQIENILSLSPQIFMFVFIPVIIFDATYFLNKHSFFRNFLEIFTFAFLGTIIQAFIVGGLLILTGPRLNTKFSIPNSFAYSSILSMVAPIGVELMQSEHVQSDLVNLAFGESTLNDGIGMTLFELFQGLDYLQKDGDDFWTIFGLGLLKFVVSFAGAVIQALFVTLLFCFLTRYTFKIPTSEPLLFLFCAMGCYVLGDSLEFSSVISIMTCALVLVRYGEYNMDKKSVASFAVLMHMLSELFESILFFDIGMQIPKIAREEAQIDYVFVFIVLPYTFIARVIAVPFLTFILNKRREKIGRKITINQQIILILCGGYGGVAFSLAKSWQLPQEQSNQVTFVTSLLVLTTMLIYGSLMRPAIKYLKIQVEPENQEDIASKMLAKPIPNVTACVEGLLGHSSKLEKLLINMDIWMQKIFLKKRLPIDRELAENAEQVQQLYIQRLLQQQKEQKEKEQQRWRDKYIKKKVSTQMSERQSERVVLLKAAQVYGE